MGNKERSFASCSDNVWDSIADHVGDDGNWDGKKFTVKEPPFTVTIDVHAEAGGRSSYLATRLRGAFINLDGFCFGVKRRTWMSDLASYFGSKDLEIGDQGFDREFVIKANSQKEIRDLLAGDPESRKLMVDCKKIQRLEVRDHEGWFGPEFPKNVDELYLEADGRITDVEAIKTLYRIFAGALTRLCVLGSAYEGDPKINL